MYKILEECAANKKSPIPDFENFSNKILADGLDHSINYIQMSRDNNLKITTDDRLKEVFSDFANLYVKLFSKCRLPKVRFDFTTLKAASVLDWCLEILCVILCVKKRGIKRKKALKTHMT
jgi:rRNA pseudouridine-1189 N-methylase Emg1 (Nep1/Mra1 family)